MFPGSSWCSIFINNFSQQLQLNVNEQFYEVLINANNYMMYEHFKGDLINLNLYSYRVFLSHVNVKILLLECVTIIDNKLNFIKF